MEKAGPLAQRKCVAPKRAKDRMWFGGEKKQNKLPENWIYRRDQITKIYNKIPDTIDRGEG